MMGRLRAVPAAGFTMVEMLIATAITMAVVGAVLTIVTPVQTMLRAADDAADLNQRIRAGADTLAADLRAATAVRPYRVGAVGDDGAAGVYYRPDTISLLGVPSAALSLDADATRTYYLKPDPETAAPALMRYDGGLSDLPMIQHVVYLAFAYLGPAGRIEPAALADGPWVEDAAHRFFDADVLRIVRVHVTLRLEGTAPSLRRLVPEQEVTLQVALRSLARAE